MPSRISNLRRAALFVLIVLQLGVITTLILAWSLAGAAHSLGKRDPVLSFQSSNTSAGNGWQVIEYAGRGRRSRMLEEINEANSFDSEFSPSWWSLANQSYEDVQEQILEDERGWPFLSLRCRWIMNKPFTPTSEVLSGGLATKSFKPFWTDANPGNSSGDIRTLVIDDHRALPFIPIWLGFIASTLFHAAIWTLAVLFIGGIFGLRRRLRRKRNCCVQCGYSRRHSESPICTECGHDARSREPIFCARRIRAAAACAAIMFLGTIGFALFLIGRVHSPHALHLAAANNDVLTIERLLTAGANADVRCSPDVRWSMAQGDTTPLMWACGRGHEDATRALIAGGANPRASTRYERTPLYSATQNNHPNVVRFLLNLPAAIAPDVPSERMALLHAAEWSPTETLQLLLDACAGRDASATPLPLYRALSRAAGAGRVDNMRSLIAADAPVDLPKPYSPLLSAIYFDQFEAVKLLLEHGASVSRPDEPLVREAAELRRKRLIPLLLEASADPNLPDRDGRGQRALHAAVNHSDIDLVRMLLAGGADPTLTDVYGSNVLFFINWPKASVELVDVLLNLGLDINHRDVTGQTVLMHAAQQRSSDGVKRLLEAGADPTIVDKADKTALDYVLMSHGPVDPEVVRLLREHLD